MSRAVAKNGKKTSPSSDFCCINFYSFISQTCTESLMVYQQLSQYTMLSKVNRVPALMEMIIKKVMSGQL